MCDIAIQTKYKMILKGMCNVIFLSCVITAIFLLAQSQFQNVVAQISEMNDDQVTLKTVDAGSFVGQRKPLSESIKPSDPNELPRTYFSFKGIPYASPPLGPELRWKGPQPVEVRRQAKMTTEYKPVCSQWDSLKRKVIGSQDCLYLNVFTPYVPSSVRRPVAENITSWTVENRNLLPVLIYIHGGEFLSGSGNLYGPERFMKENAVLVTINYRLGIFGFLSNGNTYLPGNYGLLDQIEALRWVQQNIYRFGGNPLRVAIFGNIEYLLMIPGARGLFHAAILNPSSTSLFSPFEKPHNPKELTRLIAKNADCPFTEDKTQEMVECLKITDVERLIRIQQRFFKFFNYPSQGLGPVVDKEWAEYPNLHENPQELLEEGKFATNVPLMIGVSAYEGFNPFFEFYAKFGVNRSELLRDQEFVKERLQETLKIILGIDEDADEDEYGRIFESIWRYYFGGISSQRWENDSSRVLWKLFRVFGDLTMQSGHRKFLHLVSAKGKAPVFNYVFNHSIEHFSSYLESRIKSLGVKERDSERTLHSFKIPPWKELYYLFEPLDTDNSTGTNSYNSIGRDQSEKVEVSLNNLNSRNFTTEDEKLSEFLVKLWISFASYGSPKQIISKLGGSHGKWQRVSGNNLNYYVIGTESYSIKTDFRKAESKFWLSILPQIQELSAKISKLEPFSILFWVFVGLTSALVFISLILIIFICCHKSSKGRSDGFGEDNVVFLNKIQTM